MFIQTTVPADFAFGTGEITLKDVKTLIHEFTHGLYVIKKGEKYQIVSNNYPRDLVEFVSTLSENLVHLFPYLIK